MPSSLAALRRRRWQLISPSFAPRRKTDAMRTVEGEGEDLQSQEGRGARRESARWCWCRGRRRARGRGEREMACRSIGRTGRKGRDEVAP